MFVRDGSEQTRTKGGELVCWETAHARIGSVSDGAGFASGAVAADEYRRKEEGDEF